MLRDDLSFTNRCAARVGKRKFVRTQKKIENNYVVVLDDSVIGERGEYSIADYMAEDMARTYRGKLKHVYKHAINGFSVEMSEADAEEMAQDYRVLFVEEDGVMTTDATQTNPPWGLDRIDQRNRPLSATYTYNWTGSGFAFTSSTRAFAPPTRNSADARRTCSMRTAATGRTATATVRTSPARSAVQTYGVAKSALLRGVRVFELFGQHDFDLETLSRALTM